MRHRLGLATRTQISVCKSPFPFAGTAVPLFHSKTVQHRPLLVHYNLQECDGQTDTPPTAKMHFLIAERDKKQHLFINHTFAAHTHLFIYTDSCSIYHVYGVQSKEKP